MKTPVWISEQVIFALHEKLIARFGGLSGIRDEDLLDSALNRPLNLFAYGEPTLFELAAEYAFGIVKNHPFLDGNKRTGFMAAYAFLKKNGKELNASEESATLQTLALAAGEIGGKEYAKWLSESCE